MKAARKQICSLLLACLMCMSFFSIQGSAEDPASEGEPPIPENTDAAVLTDASLVEEEIVDIPEDMPDARASEDADEDLVPEKAVIPEESRYEEELVPEEESRVNGRNCITGFVEPAVKHINEVRKPALCAVLAMLPEEIGVYLGGIPSAEDGKEPEGAELRTVSVAWECEQDYDEWLNEYAFVPVTEGFELAEGVKVPMITLTVEDLSIPPSGHVESEDQTEVPIVGAAGGMRRTASAYNGYEMGVLPPIRDQNPYGACWAFAAIAAAEADLIADGSVSPGSVDLSELHLAYFAKHTYTDPKGLNIGDWISDSYSADYLDAGGNDNEATLTMANLAGPVDESYAPYDTAAVYAPLGTEAKACTSVQLVGTYELNPDDRSAIKEAILEHGGVTASIMAKHNEGCYSAKGNCFYYPGSGSDHAVLLVGWDDSFSKDRFLQGRRPAGDGAWLVRNSWGYEGYSFYGYFWLSYYDGGLLSSRCCTAYDVEAVVSDNVYACDTLAPLTTWYYSIREGDSVVQHLTVDEDEIVEAVGMKLGANNNVSVTVSDGSRTAKGSFISTYSGFYRIRLNQPIPVSERKELTITVKYNAPGQLYYEGDYMTDYYSGARVYESSCGSGGFIIDYADPQWRDQSVQNDACIKLYTNNSVQPVMTTFETTLNLADYTGINVYVGLPRGASPSAYTIEASYHSYRQNYTKGPVALSALPKGSGERANMYKFEPLRAASTELSDTVTVTLRKGGKVIRTEAYSVRGIAEDRLESGMYLGDAETLHRALLQYGRYGQLVFHNREDDLPGTEGAPALVSIPTEYAPKNDPTGFGAYVTKFEGKLDLNAAISMNLYLTFAGGYSANDFNIRVLDKDGQAYGKFAVTDTGGNRVQVRITGILSPQLARDFQVVVTLKNDSTKTASWTRSALTCAYATEQANADVYVKSLMQALYQYYRYAALVFPQYK